MNMEHIYRELERISTSSRVHKFSVFVSGDIKEIYENEYLIARIDMTKKTYYTEYKLMGDVILFSRYLRNLGYKSTKYIETTNPTPWIFATIKNSPSSIHLAK